MTHDSILYLSRRDVENIAIGMDAIIEAIDRMFVEKGQNQVEMPPKPGIHPQPDAFIHAMPAYIPSLGAAGIKWISGYPRNQDLELPYISGLIILNDPHTGFPTVVMDATWVTAMRTGAATAVAARYLARTDSNSVGILGSGVQGRSNLEALHQVFDLTHVRVFDIHPERSAQYAREMGKELDLEIQPAATAQDAVYDMDIVVTAGPILKNPLPTIEAGWLAEGAFASPVDFDSYWQPEALAEADKITTDDLGQMEYYRKEGYFRKTPAAHADLGQIAAGIKVGRESASERIIGMNLGLALEDMATAILIYEQAVSLGVGQTLPL